MTLDEAQGLVGKVVNGYYVDLVSTVALSTGTKIWLCSANKRVLEVSQIPLEDVIVTENWML